VAGFVNSSQKLLVGEYELEIGTLENDARLKCQADGTTTVVKIFGREYPLRCTGDRDELLKIAEYVDAVMRRVAESSAVSAHSDLAVLAALNIASEFMGALPANNISSDDFQKRTQSILLRLEKSLPELESA
jgi:cell division protein ZapA (FtsZ GTPase activity inhibitor)